VAVFLSLVQVLIVGSCISMMICLFLQQLLLADIVAGEAFVKMRKRKPAVRVVLCCAAASSPAGTCACLQLATVVQHRPVFFQSAQVQVLQCLPGAEAGWTT